MTRIGPAWVTASTGGPERVERGEPGGAAGGHGGKRLAAWRGGIRQGAPPSVHGFAAEILPAAAFPIAEIEFLQPVLDGDLRPKPRRQIARAPGGARHDAAALRQARKPQGGGVERVGNAFEVEPAVAQPRLAAGAWGAAPGSDACGQRQEEGNLVDLLDRAQHIAGIAAEQPLRAPAGGDQRGDGGGGERGQREPAWQQQQRQQAESRRRWRGRPW